MASNAAFQPRFSVRAAFDGGVIDVADGRYATEVARQKQNAPRPNCYNPNARPEVFQANQVQAGNPGVYAMQPLANPSVFDATPTDPQPQDRDYWKSKGVVQNPAIKDRVTLKPEEEMVEAQRKKQHPHQRQPNHPAHGVRWQVDPYQSNKQVIAVVPTPQPGARQFWQSNDTVTAPIPGQEGLGTMTRDELIRMGDRENQLQRQLRHPPQIVNLPANALNGEPFTLYLPEGANTPSNFQLQLSPQVTAGEPIPFQYGVDTADQYAGHLIAPDTNGPVNREYWRSGQAVTSKKFASKNE